MDAAAVLDAVRSANATELERLGSEKALVAATGADLERGPVLEAVAVAVGGASETFEEWATGESETVAREAFERAAERERDHLARIGDLAEGETPASDPETGALESHLRSLSDTGERVGAGLVARPLVASRTLLQAINFFVNEGDTAAAETLREVRAETDAAAESGAEVTVEICAEEADREAALDAASAAIDAAYGEYAERLEAMGVDPKPVC